MTDFERGIMEVQLVIADRATIDPFGTPPRGIPARDDYYFSKPWYWRLWHDIRTSRIWRIHP